MLTTIAKKENRERSKNNNLIIIDNKINNSQLNFILKSVFNKKSFLN